MLSTKHGWYRLSSAVTKVTLRTADQTVSLDRTEHFEVLYPNANMPTKTSRSNPPCV